MQINRDKHPAPATVGYLRENDLRLQVHCETCGKMHYRPFDTLADDIIVPEIAERYRLKCKFCHSRPASTRPGHPNGYGGWPRESK